jgi:hypothetical protein
MEPIRITSLNANDQLLYFTSTSLTRDDRVLVMISDRTGHPNLFAKWLDSGEERQLTFNDSGALKSYVYFDGRPDEGLGKASVCLHPESGQIYYIEGREIRTVDLNGAIRILNRLPAHQVTAFTHVSADGTRLCVPTTDARALEYDRLSGGRPPYDIDERIREEGLCSYLRIYDTQTGEEIRAEPVPRAWITHVQFSPLDRDLILYNHEWPSDCGIRRVWLWDGKRHIRVRTEDGRRSREDWTCHEMWTEDGQSVIYHGMYKGGPAYVGKFDLDGKKITEIALPPNYRKYGHFTVGRRHRDWLVSDGYYTDGAPPAYFGGDWLSVQRVNWNEGTMQWIPLCRHGSNWDSQDSHPHPIFSHDDSRVYFTSNKDGKRAVYSVQVEME